MKNQIIMALFILCCFLFSCATKEGNITGTQKDKGAVSVSLQNSIENGHIYINGIYSNFITPDNISLYPGTYTFKIILPGYSSEPDSHVVIVEENKSSEIFFNIEAVESGNVTVNSVPGKAEVKIDGINFGNTPLTVNGLQTGKHNVMLTKSGYQHLDFEIDVNNNQQLTIEKNMEKSSDFRYLVLEHFSNTSCGSCDEMDIKIEEVIHNNDSIGFISIGYHPKFPSPDDPFYTVAPEDNDHRMEHYGISQTPKVFLDGSEIQYFNNIDYFPIAIEPVIQERISNVIQMAKMDIWIENSFLLLSGKVKIESLTNDFPENTKLRIVLIEKEIHFSEPPGSDGNDAKDFYDIMRKFYPNAAGVSISLGQAESQTVDFEFEMEPNWTGGLQVVAFLQTGDDGEIFSGVKSLVYPNIL